LLQIRWRAWMTRSYLGRWMADHTFYHLELGRYAVQEGVAPDNPDQRIQEVVRLIFARFRELGSARQVLLSMLAQGVHFPRPSDGKKLVAFDWTPIRYRNVIAVLKNPF